MPAVKTHTLNTNKRFKDGTDMIADCGELVKNAIWMHTWDSEDEIKPGTPVELEGAMGDKNLCRKCRKISRVHSGKRYVVRIANGQELKHSEI